MSSSSSSKKTVSFNTIEIIELGVTIGDNPSCKLGTPITVGWESQGRSSYDVDYFESHRPERRTKHQLCLTRSFRQSILLHTGHDIRDIVSAATEAQKVRKQRKETLRELQDELSDSDSDDEKYITHDQSSFAVARLIPLEARNE